MARRSVREANLTLRLWTSEDEKSVGACVVHALRAENEFDAAIRYSAWDDAVLQWFRGALPVEDFGRTYRELIASQAEWARDKIEAARKDRRAARDKFPNPLSVFLDDE